MKLDKIKNLSRNEKENLYIELEDLYQGIWHHEIRNKNDWSWFFKNCSDEELETIILQTSGVIEYTRNEQLKLRMLKFLKIWILIITWTLGSLWILGLLLFGIRYLFGL